MLLVLTMFTSMFASTAFAVTDSSLDRQIICLDIQTELSKQAARSLMPVNFQFKEKMNLYAKLGGTLVTRGIAEFDYVDADNNHQEERVRKQADYQL